MQKNLNKCHMPSGAAQLPAMSIKKIWQVDEGSRYSNTVSWAGQTNLIMVRTHRGGGVFTLSDGTVLQMPSWSFVILRASDILKYRTYENRWQFWWFEVYIAGELPIPINRVFECGTIDDESRRLVDMCDKLATSRGIISRSAPVAMLFELICKWCGELDREQTSPQEDFVRKVTSIFKNNLSQPLSVERVAEEFNMSPRWFRKKFMEATGLPPKKYYDKMRMEIAIEMLRMNTASVGRLSKSLGYSSLYHFSRAFKKHFGKSPSKI